MSRTFALAAGIAAALAAPGAASAATLTVSNGAATLTGDARANTLVAVDVKGLGTFFGDQNAPTTNPGLLNKCTSLGPPVAPFAGVACLGITSVTINGGGGADQLVANPGHPASVNGEAGDDTLIGGAENDVFRGGFGTDRVAYVAPTGAGIDRSAGVRATLPETGGAPSTGNGQTGESDTIASDIEGLVGGQGNDVLTGNSGPNTIAGAAPPGTASVTTAPAGRDTVRGGAGDDTLLGGDTGTVTGGDGDDTVVGGRSTAAGALTVVTGDDGKDTLVSGLGNDSLSGGRGADQMAYASASAAGLKRTAGVTVRLPEGKTPGSGGRTGGAERDVIPDNDIETYVGGNGNDVLIGNSSSNTLAGVAPEGTAGVTPGPAGNDTFDGRGGNDIMLGAEGNDTMTGGPGLDVFLPVAGDDRVLSRDALGEGIACGAGNDFVRADAKDTLEPDCEQADQPAAARDRTKPKVSVFPRRLRVRKGRRVRLFVRCRNEKRGCKGTVRLRLGKRTLARKAFAAKSTKRRRVVLRIRRSAPALAGRARVRVTVKARDGAGNKRTKTVKASLRS